MAICKKENKNKSKNRTIKKEEKPNWFDKKFEENVATSDDIAALEASLKDL